MRQIETLIPEPQKKNYHGKEAESGRGPCHIKGKMGENNIAHCITLDRATVPKTIAKL